MKKSIAKKWVKALRSGEYKQAHQRLRVCERANKSFCCLGVLCDLVKEKMGKDWNRSGFCGNRFYLPIPVQEFAGLPISEEAESETGNSYNKVSLNEDLPKTRALLRKCGILPHDYYWHPTLADLNDKGATFEELADVIEENFC